MRRSLFLLCMTVIVACKDSSKKNANGTDAIVQTEKSPELQESISRGASVYNNFCASCHLSGGEGINGVFPPLENSDWLTEKRKQTIRAVKYGLNGPIEVNGQEYDNLMPNLGLSDRETTDVLNYIFYSWGNQIEKPASIKEVEAIEK